MMKFQGYVLSADDKPDIRDPSADQIKRVLSSLKSQGPTSFASLTSPTGDFVQAAGGQASCMIEKRIVGSERLYRAYQNERSQVFADGTILSFNGGNVALNADEWFRASAAIDLFLAFACGSIEPSIIQWRDVTEKVALQ